MNCSNCDSKLKKVAVKSHYGVNIELNQCSLCGGIWCDDLEMFRISPKSARKIDKVNIQKLKELKPIKKALKCPKCKSSLKEFKDPYFPKQINLEHCLKCGGFWLNRGELTQFKKWQKGKITKSRKELSEKDKELAKEMNRMLESSKDRTLETWGKIGDFLSQPAHPYNIGVSRPMRVYRYHLKDEKAAKVAAYMYIVIYIISQIARRLIGGVR
jgi:Zn-finger nucleic acid-binding protein